LYIGLTNGLVGSWSFNGPDMNATQTVDRSGQNNHGTLTNGPTRTAGKIGQALQFDGDADTYINAGNSTTLDLGTNDQTIALWVNLNSTQPLSHSTLVSKGGEWHDIEGYALIFKVGDDSVIYYVSDGTTRNNDMFLPSSGIADNQWHHVVIVHDRDTAVYFYIDGTLRRTVDAAFNGTDISNTGKNLVIGGHWANNWHSTGLFDDVRIYNRALSDLEIKRLYNIGAGSKLGVTRTLVEDGLVGHWTFDGEHSGPGYVLDVSGNNTTGVLTNGPQPTDGQIGQAFEFNGEDAYIAVGNAGSGIQTIAFWMYAHDTTTRDIIDLDGTDQIQLNGGGQITATDFPAATIYVDGEAGNSVTPNTWHHILVTDATGVNATALEIGRVTTSNEFDGILDDIRLYNRVLSPDELQRIYNGTKESRVSVTTSAGSLSDGLAGHWSFDGNVTGPTWTDDVSGNGNSGSLIDGPRPTDGVIGQAFEFDGEDAYIAVGNAGSGIQTVGFWMYAHDTTTRDIIDLDGTDQIQLNGSSQIVATGFPAATVYVDGQIGNSVTPNTWHHVLITDTVGVNATALEIGRVTTSNEFDGIIDDVRIYNRALTDREIQRLSVMGHKR
jgi:hypothetical protein